MKILVSILSALTLTVPVTISIIPISFLSTVKKDKIKKHHEDKHDNEDNEEENVSLQEEKQKVKHAKQIVEYLEDQEFDFTADESFTADGEKTWKQAFSILEKNISELFNFENDDELSDISLDLLSFNFTFA